MDDPLGTIRLFRWRGTRDTRCLARLGKIEKAPWGTEHRLWDVIAATGAIHPKLLDMTEHDAAGWQEEQPVPRDMLPEYFNWTRTPHFDRALKGE